MSSIPIQFISKKASGYEGFSSGLELTDDSNLEYPEEDALYPAESVPYDTRDYKKTDRPDIYSEYVDYADMKSFEVQIYGPIRSELSEASEHIGMPKGSLNTIKDCANFLRKYLEIEEPTDVNGVINFIDMKKGHKSIPVLEFYTADPYETLEFISHYDSLDEGVRFQIYDNEDMTALNEALSKVISKDTLEKYNERTKLSDEMTEEYRTKEIPMGKDIERFTEEETPEDWEDMSMASLTMQKSLIRLADKLDKAGFYKEADLADEIVRMAMDEFDDTQQYDSLEGADVKPGEVLYDSDIGIENEDIGETGEAEQLVGKLEALKDMISEGENIDPAQLQEAQDQVDALMALFMGGDIISPKIGRPPLPSPAWGGNMAIGEPGLEPGVLPVAEASKLTLRDLAKRAKRSK